MHGQSYYIDERKKTSPKKPQTDRILSSWTRNSNYLFGLPGAFDIAIDYELTVRQYKRQDRTPDFFCV